MESDHDSLEECMRHPRQFLAAMSRPGRPVYLRRVRRPGWRAHLPIYVLWCGDCERYSVTHPAGYGRIGCRHCRRYARVLTWARVRDKMLLHPLFILLCAIAALAVVALRSCS